MKRYPILSILMAVALASALSACSMFRERSDYYTKANETRPLEVPPDLDSPATTNELTVPAAGTGAGTAGAATPGVTGISENELRVADNVQSTWQRVGAALDRAKLGTVSARDENAHSYTVDFTGSVSTKPESERHWYTPVLEHLGFGEDEKKDVTRHVTVAVADDPAGARVTVASDGADQVGVDATRRVLDVLRQNLSVSAPAVASAPPPAAVTSAPPAAAVAGAPPAIAGVSVAGADLHVADTVQNTWQRVGLALERAQIGTLSGRDEGAHTYTLDFNSTVEAQAPAEHHWYTRILHPFGGGGGKTEQVKRSLVVRVADDSGGSRVSVEGDTSDKSTADAARRVIEVLRDRLS